MAAKKKMVNSALTSVRTVKQLKAVLRSAHAAALPAIAAEHAFFFFL
jgi:hypothetical protein